MSVGAAEVSLLRRNQEMARVWGRMAEGVVMGVLKRPAVVLLVSCTYQWRRHRKAHTGISQPPCADRKTHVVGSK
jgi:hypothetical protein